MRNTQEAPKYHGDSALEAEPGARLGKLRVRAPKPGSSVLASCHLMGLEDCSSSASEVGQKEDTGPEGGTVFWFLKQRQGKELWSC
jgi:hypothetical protein